MTSRRMHLYHILVSALLVVLLAGLALQQTPQTVRAQANATITPDSLSKTVGPGQNVSFTLTISNNLGSTQVFTPTVTSPPAGFQLAFNPTSVSVPNGSTGTVTLQVTVPAGQAAGNYQFQVNAPYPGATTIPSTPVQVVVSNTVATNTPSQGTARIEPSNQRQNGDPGSSLTFSFTLFNQSTLDRTFNIGDLSGVPAGFSSLIPIRQLVIPANGSASFEVIVNINSDRTPGTSFFATVTATAADNSNVRAQAQLQVYVTIGGQTPTVSPTPSQTQTNTATTGPSLTATPPVCQDAYEPDGDMGSAKVIELNLPQPSTAVNPNVPTHTICPVGDEDWLYFGGLAGKVYTIDITEMAPGIDLSLALYDEEGRLLAFNDDYFNRPAPTPDARNNPQGNDYTNIRPRIQSWTAPSNGRFYIQVRDSAGRGRERAAYSIVLQSESYGPTPTQIAELCQDLFEPDGLPEQARLITSNEIQLAHTLCPTGDADWVYFFGKAGKTYFMFTDTRPYISNSPRGGAVNKETEAGADTVVFLLDRDGVSLLDFNDDIPGGSTLDSQIEFTPTVDGFYFLQIKNIGDIGNQFIRYDFTLHLCLPGQTDCGRPQELPATPTLPPTSGGVPSSTPADFDLDATVTPTPTASPTATTQAARDSGSLAVAAPRPFASLLVGLWQREERLVATR